MKKEILSAAILKRLGFIVVHLTDAFGPKGVCYKDGLTDNFFF
jgi:hypothetical protein